ncbi:DUF6456 domain-containing protein [Sphingomicrobium aestuariivivum]|uniref:DUF6456 domain-containing protein n=1 Tax=Sphingomicrobium aestuariivivum TaxID=1582356 RepID=UPI001FD6CA8F|nr:DUF6456 domain-containing protein [Sphingomicrobium aestuariivivum]MCJ8190345.1 DUF6456 domain-containing protein [Sphingomicrobium aestuariivivum]
MAGRMGQKRCRSAAKGTGAAGQAGRQLEEVAIDGEVVGGRPSRRSVTVNRLESPLGWLRSRGHVSERQYEAGERLRADYERAQLSSRVTMAWDASPVARSRGGSVGAPDLSASQIDAKARFEAAVAAAGKGLDDILWRVACAGEGMREAERALGWPARAGKLVLVMALDRVADFYRIR